MSSPFKSFVALATLAPLGAFASAVPNAPGTPPGIFRPGPEASAWIQKGDLSAPRIAALPESREAYAARMAWFNDARFGMFIHWGPMAVMGGYHNGLRIQNSRGENSSDWIFRHGRMTVAEYRKVIEEMDPKNFDARAIVATAKRNGMRYLTMVTKHHDGFCLWPTDQPVWNIRDTAWWKKSHRDPIGELAEACREAGITFCVYYSITDWSDPVYEPRLPWLDKEIGGKPDFEKYYARMTAELTELITRYKPGMIWFDGNWDATWDATRGQDLYNKLRTLDPKIIVNSRVGKGQSKFVAGDYLSCELFLPKPETRQGIRWETCMTMNGTWGFDRDKEKQYRSASDFIRNLADCVCGGGNYLLNIGPDGEGSITPGTMKVLDGVGEWANRNAEAIYGTSAGPESLQSKDVGCSRKADKLFLFIKKIPSDRKVRLPARLTGGKATLLGFPDAHIGISSESDATLLTLPQEVRDDALVIPVIAIGTTSENRG